MTAFSSKWNQGGQCLPFFGQRGGSFSLSLSACQQDEWVTGVWLDVTVVLSPPLAVSLPSTVLSAIYCRVTNRPARFSPLKQQAFIPLTILQVSTLGWVVLVALTECFQVSVDSPILARPFHIYGPSAWTAGPRPLRSVLSLVLPKMRLDLFPRQRPGS